jgi:hypothetical protein
MHHRTIRRAVKVAALVPAAAVLIGCTATATDASGAAAAPAASAPAHRAVVVRPCTAAVLKVSPAHQAAHRPAGTGTGAAIVAFTNTGRTACTLKGFPTVAGAGNGSPQLNVPLRVRHSGAASTVRLAHGARAWVKLTFVQVQGEGDGYCVSGSAPVVYPTLVIGLPGAGKHQTALDDGQFAECDDTVTVTALTARKPT